MNNVNELKNSNPQEKRATQTISLSALTGDGLPDDTETIIESNQMETAPVNTIKISPNIRKKPIRPIDGGESTRTVIDPNEFMPKPDPVKSVTPRDVAMSQLDACVKQRINEYNAFVQEAVEDDAENRERVEAGIDTVGDELKYIPDELYKIDESSKPVSNNKENDVNDDFEEDDSIANIEVNVPTKVSIQNNFFEDEEPENEPNTDNEEVVVDTEEEYIQDITTTVNEPAKNVDEDMTDSVPEQSNIDKEIHDNLTKGSLNITTSALNDAVIADSKSSDFNIEDEDLDDVANVFGNDENLTNEQIQEIYEASEKRLKSEILKKIIQAGKKIDTTQFVVSNKVISAKDALSRSGEVKSVRTASWPMTFAGRPFIASALKGPDIALLADTDDSDDNNSVGLTIAQARIMFEHDANPYRPATLEAWAKTIPFTDVDNIFAALYCASLKGANYIPMMCPKPACQYSYLSDDTDINTMLKFKNDKAKERFNSIKSITLTPENTGSYESVVSLINDKYAVGLKLPSIYTVLYEYAALDNAFISKYASAVAIIQYIDYIYFIDKETKEYQPIGWKAYAGDNTKTFKSKIATYSKILKELDDTDFSILIALISSMTNKAAEYKSVSYEIPEAKCPKCGTVIEAREISPRALVFMRQRLVDIATTPSEK